MIEYSSDEAAKKVTVTGWMSKDGHFWGDNEHMARWSGCTHLKCECGATMEKGWTKCESCREKSKQEKFEKFKVIQWDYKTPISIYDTDTYFFDEQDLLDYCDDEGLEPEELQLVLCKQNRRRVLNVYEFLEDDVHEDWDPSADLEAAVIAFNEAVAKDPYQTWFATDTRVTLAPKEKEAENT